MAGTVRLEIDGAIGTIVNDNPDKHNAFDDEMDAQLFGILDTLAPRRDIGLTGRVLTADEALTHGIVSRVVPEEQLDTTVREMAEQIAAAPAVTVKMAREVIRHLALPQIRSSMNDEMIYQTFINRSDDFAEIRDARD